MLLLLASGDFLVMYDNDDDDSGDSATAVSPVFVADADCAQSVAAGADSFCGQTAAFAIRRLRCVPLFLRLSWLRRIQYANKSLWVLLLASGARFALRKRAAVAGGICGFG